MEYTYGWPDLVISLFIIGAAIVALVYWFIKAYRYRQDMKAIYNFLMKPEFTWRTTEAISSNTNIPTNEVQLICYRDSRIIKGAPQTRELWALKKRITPTDQLRG